MCLDPSQKLRGQARHRHPLRRDRGDRGRHSRRRARCACSTPPASWCMPGLVDLHAHVYPVRLGHRHSRPTSWCRSRAPPPWCRRATPAPTTSPPSAATSWRRRARASTPSCTSPTSASPASRIAELYNIDFAQAEAAGARRSRRTPTSRSASRCACRENVIAQARPRAAQARDPRLRDRRRRRAR